MKYLKASVICFVCAAVTLLLMGCSGLNTKSPEYQTALEVQSRAYALAAQVRGTEPVSQIEAVRAGEPFYANCVTYSLTVKDMLIAAGANPADVQLVTVRTRPGFGWVYENGAWSIDQGELHQLVVWNSLVLDNRFDRVVAREDLNREYEW